jgi:hypothetical protein
MRITLIRPFAAATLILGVPAVVQAQNHSGHQQQPKPLVDETFTIPHGQFVRVFLAGGSIYRVEIAGSGLQLRLTPVESGVQQPLVQELLSGQSASGSVLYTVRPRADAVYELRSVGGEAGRPVNVKVTLQPKEKKDS